MGGGDGPSEEADPSLDFCFNSATHSSACILLVSLIARNRDLGGLSKYTASSLPRTNNAVAEPDDTVAVSTGLEKRLERRRGKELLDAGSGDGVWMSVDVSDVWDSVRRFMPSVVDTARSVLMAWCPEFAVSSSSLLSTESSESMIGMAGEALPLSPEDAGRR